METQPPRLPRLQDALATLAAPRRFDLLVLMLAGPDRSVSQLAEAVGLSQSCTTRHLQALARAGLVKGVRDGKRVVFRIAPRDGAARAVLASIAGGAPSPEAKEPPQAPTRPRRRPGPRPGPRPGKIRAPRKLLESEVRIESAVELEPFTAGDGNVSYESADGLRQEPESGRTSEPEATPVWRRSDLEDFLL